ncbi:MarR family winged helix-turn-helix transcriptional regulator [Flexivirga meconopsidis]|uniref:MarR family winged helix-turn-helix transcriptional regulator n=1 Tax=Flexivirga meconopsidis TaxID=2977121 RepID=UPI00223EB04A|nr:MarR family transcriptional regulator [Flexivirga meconopsidis]
MSARTDDELAAHWHQLMGDYARLTCALDRALQAECEISSSEFDVLEQLATADECSVRMADLAEHVHLSQSALSRLVTRLERDGLAERATCTADRRSIFVAATAKGTAKYDEARPVQRAVLRTETAKCSPDSGVCAS